MPSSTSLTSCGRTSTQADLAAAVQAFVARDRRYGGVRTDGEIFCVASERRERATRPERAGAAASEGACAGSPRGEAPRLKMRRFLVCIHDATPAYARETQVMIRDLAPVARASAFVRARSQLVRRVATGGASRLLPPRPRERRRDSASRLLPSASARLGADHVARRRVRRDERAGSGRNSTHPRARPACVHRCFRRAGAGLRRTGLAAGARSRVPGKSSRAGLRPRLFLPGDSGRPKGSPRDLDVGLWSLGLVRTPWRWDRVAVSVPGSRSPYAGDPPQRSGARLLAEDPPAHTAAPREAGYEPITPARALLESETRC